MKLTSLFLDLSQDNLQKRLNPLVSTLIDTITEFLELDLMNNKYAFLLTNPAVPREYKPDSIFNYGVERIITDNKLEIRIYENHINFLPFILLREIYNLFIPREIWDYEWIQLTVNQMILTDLSNHDKVKEWGLLIRENVKLYENILDGFERISDYAKLEQFFKNPALKKTSYNLFFKMIREDPRHLPKKNDYIHLFFTDNMITEPEYYTDELIETIRCLTEIFHKIKTYRGITEYNKLFQQFKKNGSLNTNLSGKDFVRNMEIVKSKTSVAPTYKVNWTPSKCSVFTCSFQFNPLLNKSKVLRIITKLPFIVWPRFYYNGFGVEITCFFLIPDNYVSDLLSFLENLHGYLIEGFNIYKFNTKDNIYRNYNFYRDVFRNSTIPNPNNSRYNNKYEVSTVREFADRSLSYKPTLLDLILFDRFQAPGRSGLGFERKDEILKAIRKDMVEAVSSQRGIIKQLRKTLNFFHSTKNMKDRILQFMKSNEKYGFFYIKYLITSIVELTSFLTDFKGNISQIQTSISNKRITYVLEENLLLNNKKLIRSVLKDLLPALNISRSNYLKIVEQYKKFRDLFDCCYNLKLFDLNKIKRLLEDEKELTTLYSKKDKKLAQIESKYKTYKITNQLLDDRIEHFLKYDPPIIIPNLINTVQIQKMWQEHFCRFDLSLEASQKNIKSLQRLKYIYEMNQINGIGFLNDIKKPLIDYKSYTPPLSNLQTILFWSMVNTQLDIKNGKRYIGQGQNYATTLKNFFDTETKKFFYTQDLFEHLFKYTKAVFGDITTQIKTQNPLHHLNLFPMKLSPIEYISKVNNLRERPDYNITHLTKLLHFHSHVKKTLSHNEQYPQVKEEYFFKKYVKSIKFKPSFGSFGLSQFYLFIDCPDLNDIDLQLLFLNTFQSLKFPMCIENTVPFFIKYIMPYNRPNERYLNWLTKSKKTVRSYCFYSVQKEHRIFHLDKNLTSKGWVYDKDDFKVYTERILFREDYNPQLPEMIELDFQKSFTGTIFGPNSPEFQALIKIYSTKSIDIKSFLGTKKHATLDALMSLLDKDLIFPYLSLKDLGFCEVIRIILPGNTPPIQKKLLQIFTFFNFCTVSEIEGKYFIQGFSKEKQFENGTSIKIYFPETHVGFFIDVFINLFEYLEIEHYIILHDLGDGAHIIKSTFEDVKSFDSYNPLTNLIWDETDKMWKNHKLYTENHEPIYPNLFFARNSE
ncbi:hypothetical protein LCGC14_0853540 [marine sediment metagenome]|uniref:Uncharacterized protein n=1 Tax=marine sediment metagenome TaxID=412755 RepID=A0A0F9PUR8_9ZZZZ|nr:MAG: hypothetical protein Lokiarch_08710 [Candidatus Lokiarchaeum sp. GC14_75]